LNALQLKADDSAAGRLYIGEQVSLPIKGVEMLINDKLVGRGVPNFIYGGPMDMVKWLISKIGEVNGYVSSGVWASLNFHEFVSNSQPLGFNRVTSVTPPPL
jgi:hypothetical protein